MQRLPPTAFGRTLLSLIQQSGRSQAAYARDVGLDPTWITKLIRGSVSSLTFASLENLYTSFDLTQQERLYHAWLATYAPSPAEAMEPEPWDRPEDILAYAGGIEDLIASGKALAAYASLSRLWRSLRGDPTRVHLAFPVAEALAICAEQLDRPGAALLLAGEMLHLASQLRSPEWTGKALWHRANCLRLLGRPSAGDAYEAFQDLQAYLEDAPAQTSELRYITRRDLTLCALDLASGGRLDASSLRKRADALAAMRHETPSPLEAALSSEALSRALIQLGDLASAEEQLAHSRTVLGSAKVQSQLKVRICDLELLLAKERYDRAWECYWEALDVAENFHLVQQRGRLANFETRLRLLTPGKAALR